MIQIRELLPYALLSGGAVFILLVSLVLPRRGNAFTLKISSVFIVLSTMISLTYFDRQTKPFGGLLVHDSLGFAFAQVILVLLILIIPVFSAAKKTLWEGPGAVFGLLLLSACGGLLTIYANDLLIFFIGLELLSLPLYVLTGISKQPTQSIEAAFKYFFMGATASALYIYGVALLYGAMGTTKLDEMIQVQAQQAYLNPGLLAVGGALVITGIVFKLGLVPFHMWVPDVYEGAPSYIVAWMSGASKAAVAAFGIRLLGDFFVSKVVDWSSVLSTLALASMVWGSLAALHQTNLKRMLAYSSIAHAGYMTLGLACAHEGAKDSAYSAVAFYLLSYGIATLACFVVLSIIEGDGSADISRLKGLAKRRPALALIFSAALLSLAGMPPLGGFFGKFYVFTLAIEKNYAGLVLVAVITSLISLGYYLRVIVAMYMEESFVITKPEFKFAAKFVLGIAMIAILALGIFPNSALNLFSNPPTILGSK